MPNQYILYQHAGSGNHGCEALVRTVIDTIKGIDQTASFKLLSGNPEEDRRYGLDQVERLELLPLNKLVKRGNINWIRLQFAKLFGNKRAELSAKFNLNWTKENAVFIAIGGDNYCYNKGRNFYDIDREIKGKKILWGCSVEPKDLDTELVTHLQCFDVITARETITFEALKSAGLSQTVLIPDTAFCLPAEKTNEMTNCIGINISPLIMHYTDQTDLIYANYQRLIEYILSETDRNILFLPHVVTENNDDRVAITRLLENIKIPNERYVLAEDGDCRKLKGKIQECDFFIGARTHATIAAYSTGVPTLVVGYSVKSRGIATDIFGDSDGLVVPVNGLETENDLLNAYLELMKKTSILIEKQAAYTQKAVCSIHEEYKKIIFSTEN